MNVIRMNFSVSPYDDNKNRKISRARPPLAPPLRGRGTGLRSAVLAESCTDLYMLSGHNLSPSLTRT